MFARVFSYAVIGLEGMIVEVEVDIGRDLLGMHFAWIKGQEHVKRALEVASAGSHNLLMIGTTSHSICSKLLRRILG